MQMWWTEQRYIIVPLFVLSGDIFCDFLIWFSEGSKVIVIDVMFDTAFHMAIVLRSFISIIFIKIAMFELRYNLNRMTIIFLLFRLISFINFVFYFFLVCSILFDKLINLYKKTFCEVDEDNLFVVNYYTHQAIWPQLYEVEVSDFIKVRAYFVTEWAFLFEIILNYGFFMQKPIYYFMPDFTLLI